MEWRLCSLGGRRRGDLIAIDHHPNSGARRVLRMIFYCLWCRSVQANPADLSLASLFALFGCMPDDARDRRLATVGRFDSMEPATDFAPPKTDKEHD